MRTLTLLVFLMLLLAACGTDETTDVSRSNITVEDFKYNRLPGGARVVTGRLRNPTAQPIRNAQIQVGLFDQDNRLVTTMSIVIKDVPAGDSKTFRQAVDIKENVQGARVRGVLVM